MGAIMNGIIGLFRFIFGNKGKIFGTVAVTVCFLAILFPINDLNDLITSQISSLTNRKVFLQFDSMSLSPIGPKLTLEKVFVESSDFPTLTSDLLSLNPSLMSLISRQPEGSITAQGLFKGDVQISVSTASKSEAGAARSKIELQAKELNLKDIREFTNLPVPLLGKLNISSTALADLTLTEQPEMDLNVTISQFEMPSSSIDTFATGPILLPTLKFSSVEMKGKLANGKFTIESAKIGTAKDEFYGDIKGDFGLTLRNENNVVRPIFGAYNLDINLKANTAFYQRANFFFLSIADRYKSEVPGGVQFKFKLSGASFGPPPTYSPLR